MSEVFERDEGSIPLVSVTDGGSSTSVVTQKSIFDLPIGVRIALAVAFLATQAALIGTSRLRPDGLFSFQMFNESSTIAIAIDRRVAIGAGIYVDATDGSWEASDSSGATHWFRWTDRVRDPILRNLGRPVHASYGVDAQLFRLQAALDDVVDHLQGDSETLALAADVTIRKNGRAPYQKRLESHARHP
ncbi:MAG: hypothetical protein ABW133_06690 [Polyangiaceae bacterium]